MTEDSWLRWAEDADAPMPTRRTRAAMRHDTQPIPPEYAARVERQRWRACWAVALLAFALMLAHMAGVGLGPPFASTNSPAGASTMPPRATSSRRSARFGGV